MHRDEGPGQPDDHQHQTADDERLADVTDLAAANRRGDGGAQRERRDSDTGRECAVVQSDLQIQREHEEQRGESGEVQRDHRGTERVRAPLVEPQVDDRLASPAAVGELPRDERGEHDS